jgi:hypothetical protein
MGGKHRILFHLSWHNVGTPDLKGGLTLQRLDPDYVFFGTEILYFV